MSLVFSAFTPHPPLLLPSIGKENVKKAKQTEAALGKLEEDLYLSRPDVLIIISPHSSCFSDAFTINISPSYVSDLREFGDLSTKLKFKGEMNLSSYIRESSKDQLFQTTAISEENLDHGSSVPLYFLTKHLPNIQILPIGFCDNDWKTHVDFGYMLKNDIAKTTKRIAVIASGDLSHALVTDSPAGYSETGEQFDSTIRELLANRNSTGMMQMDKQFVADASECGFRSLLILMGILKNVNYTYKEYSYEAPFGVGYLVANFIL